MRPVLACEAPHVDVPFTGPTCDQGKREYATLPFCVKGRLAYFRYDRTKSVTSAHIMRAVHRDPPSSNVGRPVPIMQSRVTIDARRPYGLETLLAERGLVSADEIVAGHPLVEPKRVDSILIVALARRLAVVMHRIWVGGTEFRWTREVAAA